MTTKKRYPKSFYDDGLGDILEWIDDEVLAPAELKSDRKRRADESGSAEELKVGKKKKTTGRTKIYGDNKVLERPDRKKVIELDLDGQDEVKLDKNIEAKSRGLINRLAAQTMPYVTSEFEKLYSTNPRSSITATIFSQIESSVIQSHALAKRKLVAELMLLVSYLDFKVSHGIGASIVHRLVSEFEKAYRGTDSTDKRVDNIICCLVNLYVTGLISANVIFEITSRLCRNDFKAKTIELLLIVIKSIGFQLRKENPSAMRQLILSAQTKCEQLKSSAQVESRIEFMIDALGAIKNNNVSKMGNYGCDVDRETIESTFKGLIKRTKLAENLSDATYEEILSSQNWYLLETRLAEPVVRESTDSKSPAHENVTALDDVNTKKEKKICKALGLIKHSERTIFSALLRVTDFIEASNVIIGFGLNHCSDAMLVCIQVAIYEKSYNPFYYDLINNLCKYNRKYKMATKFALQDKIRALSEMPANRAAIFEKLCFELIKSDAVPITILKSIEWANLSTSTKEYLSHLLQSISTLPEKEKSQIMLKVDKRSSFAGAMRTFIRCFLEECDLFE